LGRRSTCWDVLTDSCITQLKAQGPCRTCNESKEEEEGTCGDVLTGEASPEKSFIAAASTRACGERDFFIETLLVRIHFIIVMIRWTGLANTRACGREESRLINSQTRPLHANEEDATRRQGSHSP